MVLPILVLELSEPTPAYVRIPRKQHEAASQPRVSAMNSSDTGANGKGSYWRDPDMRQWESLGHAEITEFDRGA